MTVSIDLTGKRGVVWGVANQRSIAWAISERLAEAGAELAFTYLNERLKDPVAKTTSNLGNPLLIECDATDDNQVQTVYERIKKEWGEIDFVVHCIAYAEREDLGGDFSSTNLKGFRTALETSAYTLMPVIGKAAPLFGDSGGSAVTLTFDASQRVYPGYNIMGTAKAALENEARQLAVEFGSKNIRVNAISAGPLPTLAARSIPGFRDMTRAHRDKSPLGRNINHKEVADTALFLLSDMSSGITGSIIPVDAGYGIIAL
ncbi:MAG: enoyl-ACP reductase [SAR202 cluster bacterium]|nr:enoyl-[acyl-carrier-protein] reductase FabI [Chloroflexota bacterium]MQG87882.1 enoyl-ACP reductase [SAR202 cluster bacterium]|tara:strand:+ start:1084 stop:1863 length:780 start_codon:yes stop_codon:yes gene_type:complete